MLRNTKLHKLLRTVFYLPYVCSMTAVSIMWSMLLNTHYGMLPYLLGKIGITMPNMLSSTTWAMPTVIFVTVWKGFGYTLTILSAAALGVDAILATPTCCDPFCRRAVRVSMGTVFQVSWTYLGEETKPETVRNLDPEEEKEPGTGIERNPDPEEEKEPGTGIERNSEPEEKADSGNCQKQLHEL